MVVNTVLLKYTMSFGTFIMLSGISFNFDLIVSNTEYDRKFVGTVLHSGKTSV
jgi:hypothetical protein